MLSDTTKRHRETFAWAVVVYLLAGLLFDFMGLFVDLGFTVNAAMHYADFVSPLVSGLIVLAVLLVTHVAAPTPNARAITVIALALVAAMLLLGLVTWLVGMTAEAPFGSSSSRLLGALHFLLGFGLMAVAGFFVLTVYRALPVPVRRYAPYPQPGWGQQPGVGTGQGSATPQTAWTAAAQHARLRRQGAEAAQPAIQPAAAEDEPSWWARTWGQAEPPAERNADERVADEAYADERPEAEPDQGQHRGLPWQEHRGGWPQG